MAIEITTIKQYTDIYYKDRKIIYAQVAVDIVSHQDAQVAIDPFLRRAMSRCLAKASLATASS